MKERIMLSRVSKSTSPNIWKNNLSVETFQTNLSKEELCCPESTSP
jgi:hypothetical protein